mgnify:CR=1 FL=1
MKAKNQINWNNIFYLLKYEFQNIFPSLKKAMIFLVIFYILIYIASIYQETSNAFFNQACFCSLIIIGSMLIRDAYKTLFSREKAYFGLMLPSSNTEKVLSKVIVNLLLVALFFPLFNVLFTLVCGLICTGIFNVSLRIFNPFQLGYLGYINSFLFFVPFILLISIYCKKYTLGRILTFIGLSFLLVFIIWYTKEFVSSLTIPAYVNTNFLKIFGFAENHPNVSNFLSYYQWIVSVPLLWSLYYLELKKMEV